MAAVAAPVQELPVETVLLTGEIERFLPKALQGDEEAATHYTRAWRSLVRLLLSAEGAKARIDALADVLDMMAIEAPMSPWVAAHGPGKGSGLLLLSRIRAARGGPFVSEPVASTLRNLDLDRLDFARFARNVWLDLQSGEGEVARIAASWKLSRTDVARMFGVKRQAVAQWLEGGVPPARRPKLLVITRIAELLELNLLAERLPGIVRTAAEAYGGATMLEMIRADRHEELLATVALSFDWSWSA